MNQNYGPSTVTRTRLQESVLASNRVIRNTYLLLSLTLLFSAGTAYFAMVTQAPPLGLFSLLIYFGLLFLTAHLRNSVWGLVSIFALTGFLGYTLGPLLNFYIATFSNGSQLVMSSLGLTGIIFLSLSAYALTTQKDFSYLGGFLFVGMIVAFLALLVSAFFPMPIMQVIISFVIVLLMSGFILYDTSRIIHGGERNYIMATISLYISLYNLFIHLLHIIAMFSGRRD